MHAAAWPQPHSPAPDAMALRADLADSHGQHEERADDTTVPKTEKRAHFSVSPDPLVSVCLD